MYKQEHKTWEQRLEEVDFYELYADREKMLHRMQSELSGARCAKQRPAAEAGQRKTSLRTVWMAAALALLLLGTGTLTYAKEIAGWIRSLGVRQITVYQYESGAMPAQMDEPKAVWAPSGTKKEEAPPYQEVRLTSPDEALSYLGFTPFVPSDPPYGVHLETVYVYGQGDGADWSLSLYYEKGARTSSTDSDLAELIKPRVFQLTQSYVGDESLSFDAIGESREVTVNGLPAIMTEELSCQLTWVQEGVLLQLMPGSDYSEAEIIALAESLVPLETA